MTAKEKVERIVELQNEISQIVEELKEEHDLKVAHVSIGYRGIMKLHIYEESKYAELYPHYDLEVREDSAYDRCFVEVEGVEVFALKRNRREAEAK